MNNQPFYVRQLDEIKDPISLYLFHYRSDKVDISN